MVQQGMNPDSRTARRYHWLSGDLDDFVCEPHAAVCCDQRAPTLNLVAGEADTCRKTIASIAAESPEKILREAHGIRRYQALASLRDPARFSYAHGGKDGQPYPVDRETYGRSIDVLRRALRSARGGHYDRVRALRRLALFDA